MSQTLTEIAQHLKDNDKKVQLIYAFNGTGKTRLSREFKDLVAPKNIEEENGKIKVLYYNAFTEDLFYWDNDLDGDINRKLLVRSNGFTDLTLTFLKDENQDGNIITNFQHYTTSNITPAFNADFSEITFAYQSGGNNTIPNIKISKGEESNFIWCVFFTLLEQVIEVINIEEINDRSTDKFNELKYIFIDDPVSSLDDNHLIELAVNLAVLIKKSTGLKFVVSTHNPLFYNVLFNELGNKSCYMLIRSEDSTYDLQEKKGDSNKSFSYHLYLKDIIEDAIKKNAIEKYHFMLLRNLYEKTANFLGYEKWSDLLPDDKTVYYNRVIQFTSHSTLSNEVVPEPTDAEKGVVKFLLKHLVDSKYWKKEVETPTPVDNQVIDATIGIVEPEIKTQTNATI
ncbi:anticodon nuclease [Chryseobacterium flavum]|uniref:anticodon nuclease n=1 Tax=Chryseobacterium flavum TaxID=415851 RepID=UPI0028A6CE60|nr:anticodon nuclease [Chryseobacterium flavum]